MGRKRKHPKDISAYAKDLVVLAQQLKRTPNLSEVATRFDFSVTTAHKIVGSARKLNGYLSRWLQFDRDGTVIGTRPKSGGGAPQELEEENRALRSTVDNLTKRILKVDKARTLEAVLVKKVTDAIGILPVIKSVTKPSAIKGKLDGEAILLLSDAHFGEIVDREEMCGINEYNMTIAAKRIQFLVDGIFENLDPFKVKKLHIFMLGDFTSGNIHDELRETNSPNIVDCTFMGSSILAQAVCELATKYDINIIGVPGNHGRMTKKKTYKQAYVNWDYVMYRALEKDLRGQENVKTSFNHSIFRITEVQGQRFLILHGDNIRGWAGIPWYGIERATKKLAEILQSQREKPFDHICLGHFHSGGLINRTNGKVFVNPSIIGGDEYSLGALFSVAEPQQTLMLVNKKKGIQYEMPISLKDADLTEDNKMRYKL
jgi:predicted phosphodiesterase